LTSCTKDEKPDTLLITSDFITHIDGNHTWSTPTMGYTVFYAGLLFGNTMPANASSFTSYNGYNFAYNMIVE